MRETTQIKLIKYKGKDIFLALPVRIFKSTWLTTPQKTPSVIEELNGIRIIVKKTGIMSIKLVIEIFLRDMHIMIPKRIKIGAVAHVGIIVKTGEINRQGKKQNAVIIEAIPVFAPASIPARDSKKITPGVEPIILEKVEDIESKSKHLFNWRGSPVGVKKFPIFETVIILAVESNIFVRNNAIIGGRKLIFRAFLISS